MFEFALLIRIALTLVAAPEFTGSAACQTCHPAEYSSQSKTGHANALKRSVAPQPGDWAFGAGAQAITFVQRSNDSTYSELGESWYSSIKTYARTPGHATAAPIRFRLFDPTAGILSCFGCHSTGPLQVSEHAEIQPAEFGVRCETCHGPGSDHVAQPAEAKLRNPAAMDGPQMNQFCGSCHRRPGLADATPDLNDPWNARHQPLMLAASKCFRASAGKLTCLTCHDPHATVERKLTNYNAACMQCHPSVRHTKAVTKQACATCHMPLVHAQPNLAFTNHRIVRALPVKATSGNPPGSARP